MSAPANTALDCSQLTARLAVAETRIIHLEAIIARNAMQRLDDSRLYILPADIDEGITLAARYRAKLTSKP